MVKDALLMLRTGNALLTATERPEAHYVVLPANAVIDTWLVLIDVPIVTTGTPTSILHELMSCPDASDPTVNGNWVSFNPPIVYTQDLTQAHTKPLFVHTKFKYLALKSTFSGGTNPSAGNVSADVSPGRTGAASTL